MENISESDPVWSLYIYRERRLEGSHSFPLSLTDDVSMSRLSWQIYGVLGDRSELLSHCDDIARPVTEWWHIQTPVKQDKGCFRVMRSAEPELSCCASTVCWASRIIVSFWQTAVECMTTVDTQMPLKTKRAFYFEHACLVIEILPMHVRASACMRKPSLHSQWYEPSVFTHVCWQPPFSSSHSSLSVGTTCKKWDISDIYHGTKWLPYLCIMVFTWYS